MDMETVQMLITLGKHDLQDRMQARQSYIAPDKYMTPEKWADTTKRSAVGTY